MFGAGCKRTEWPVQKGLGAAWRLKSLRHLASCSNLQCHILFVQLYCTSKLRAACMNSCALTPQKRNNRTSCSD